jgi:hypothetical protein
VGVIAVLPDFSREVFANGEGEASLDQLHASARWSDRGRA